MARADDRKSIMSAAKVDNRLSTLIAELQRVYDEFGDVTPEMYDTYDMDMFVPVTHVQFDHDRQRVQIISDR